MSDIDESEVLQSTEFPSDTSETSQRKSDVSLSWLQRKTAARPSSAAILKNILWLFFDKVLRMGIALFVGVWIARYLGPSRFGLLNYAVAFSSLFGILATLGLDSIVVRELVKRPEEKEVIMGSAFALKLSGAALAVVVSVLTVAMLRPGDYLTIWIVGITAVAFIFQSLNVIDLLFQSKVQSRYTVYASNIAFLLMAVVKVVLLLKAAPVIAFAYAALGEAILTSAFLCVAFRLNHFMISTWKPRWTDALNLLRSSWPLMLSGISVMIATRADQVLIGQMLTNKDVGFYSAAVRIAEIWYFIPLGIASSSFPMLIEAKKNADNTFHVKLQKLFTVTVLSAVGFSMFFTIVASPVVKALYGAAYAPAAKPLSILIWSGVPVAFGCIWGNWMLLENKTSIIFYFQLNAAVVNIILNLLLIPKFGIVGSAYATLISYSIGHTVLAALVKSQRKALAMLGNALFPISLLLPNRTGRAS